MAYNNSESFVNKNCGTSGDKDEITINKKELIEICQLLEGAKRKLQCKITKA
jgi:hypothetical protein